jgi:hypothetical protein
MTGSIDRRWTPGDRCSSAGLTSEWLHISLPNRQNRVRGLMQIVQYISYVVQFTLTQGRAVVSSSGS